MPTYSKGSHLQNLQSVTMSDLRSSPTKCFQKAPASVTSRGKSVGFILSPEHFEQTLRELAKIEDPVKLKRQLGLSEAWFQSIVDESPG